MSFEHAFFPEVREEFAPRHVLHEHVDVFGVLGKSSEVDLDEDISTMKGCEIELKILYSLLMWSTC